MSKIDEFCRKAARAQNIGDSEAVYHASCLSCLYRANNVRSVEGLKNCKTCAWGGAEGRKPHEGLLVGKAVGRVHGHIKSGDTVTWGSERSRPPRDYIRPVCSCKQTENEKG